MGDIYVKVVPKTKAAALMDLSFKLVIIGCTLRQAWDMYAINNPVECAVLKDKLKHVFHPVEDGPEIVLSQYKLNNYVAEVTAYVRTQECQKD